MPGDHGHKVAARHLWYQNGGVDTDVAVEVEVGAKICSPVNCMMPGTAEIPGTA